MDINTWCPLLGKYVLCLSESSFYLLLKYYDTLVLYIQQMNKLKCKRVNNYTDTDSLDCVMMLLKGGF